MVSPSAEPVDDETRNVRSLLDNVGHSRVSTSKSALVAVLVVLVVTTVAAFSQFQATPAWQSGGVSASVGVPGEPHEFEWQRLEPSRTVASSFKPFWQLSRAGRRTARDQNHTQRQGPVPLQPHRIVSVFGLEDSGSKMVAKVLAHATGIAHYGDWPGETVVTDGRAVVQHVSQPWGSRCDGYPSLADEPTLPVFPVEQSSMILPDRLFVNITSHVASLQRRWPKAHVTAVLVTRDGTASLIMKQYEKMFDSRRGAHCGRRDMAEQEEAWGTVLLGEAIDKLQAPSEVVVVSYETLLLLKEAYLQAVYRQLGVTSTFTPSLDTRVSHLYQPELLKKYTSLPTTDTYADNGSLRRRKLEGGA